MTDRTIFLYGVLATGLCLTFLVVTIVQFWRIGREADRKAREAEKKG